MESTESAFKELLERAEQYSKTSIELIKLKSVSKTADLSAIAVSRILLVVTLSLFAISINIGIAFLLGDLLGKNYYGFFIVALFYGLAGVIVFFLHPKIKERLNNLIIKQMLN